MEGQLPDNTGRAQFLPPALQSPRIPNWGAGVWPNKPPFRRAARWDGIVPMKKGGAMLTPDDLREIVAYVGQQRSSAAPFDVVLGGATPNDDPAQGAAIVAAYADAGATWWLENVEPWRYGWNWQGDWPVEAMNERIRAGPPKS